MRLALNSSGDCFSRLYLFLASRQPQTHLNATSYIMHPLPSCSCHLLPVYPNDSLVLRMHVNLNSDLFTFTLHSTLHLYLQLPLWRLSRTHYSRRRCVSCCPRMGLGHSTFIRYAVTNVAVVQSRNIRSHPDTSEKFMICCQYRRE